jgi:hypothetical protein
MKLIYRAESFNYALANNLSESRNSVCNWRYQVPGFLGVPNVLRQHDRQPRAINWRYQTTTEA